MKKTFLVGLMIVASLAACTKFRTDSDKYSYALGHNIGTDLARAPFKLAKDALEEGMESVYSGKMSKPSGDTTDQARMQSYMIGQRLAQYIKSSGVPMNRDLLLAGLYDGLAGKNKMSQQESSAAMNKLNEISQKTGAEKAKKNLEEGKKFLEENRKKPGVVQTASGLQYEVLRQGTGRRPLATSKVRVHYRGTLLDGNEFDSSYKRNEPAEFQLNQVIKGWTEGLQLMNEGAKYKFYIPGDIAYGPQGNQNIPGNAVLVFEVELLKVL